MPPKRITIVALGLLLFGAFSWAASEDAGDKKQVRLSGFFDFAFSAGNGTDPGSSAFEVGQLVGHVVADLANRITFFAELSLTARDSEYKSELERAIVKFSYNDYLKVSVGRFHTPVNWWNAAFHHGQWLQTTIGRPEMTRFGSEFIPVHFVGGLVEGNIPSGPAHLNYTAGVGNGRSENIARAGDAGDVNNNRAVLLKLFARPDRPYRLEVGGSVYLDKISRTGQESFDETLGSLYVVWSGETPEVIGEWAHLDREGEITGDSFSSSAWYLQTAYRLPWAKERLKPYARYENIDVAAGEPVFTTQTDSEVFLVGLRADVSRFVAVKGEYHHQRTDREPYDHVFFGQVSLAF